MGVTLVTLQQAKDQVRVYGFADDDSQLLLKAEQASDIVVDYIKRPDHGWTDRTCPGHVRSAVLLVLGNLFGTRGDDAKTAEPLSQPVKDLLWRERDPALA
jgi:hypothetical protein